MSRPDRPASRFAWTYHRPRGGRAGGGHGGGLNDAAGSGRWPVEGREQSRLGVPSGRSALRSRAGVVLEVEQGELPGLRGVMRRDLPTAAFDDFAPQVAAAIEFDGGEAGHGAMLRRVRGSGAAYAACSTA
jgi:hypothetical protein